MANVGKTQLLILISCPAEEAEEGKRIFGTHGPWMAATHHQEGNKALLSYEVSWTDEISNPMDTSSEPTGRTLFVLNEIYETPDGVQDHMEQADASWDDFPAFGAWLEKCTVSGTAAAPIMNSLW